MPVKKRREKIRALDHFCRLELKTGMCLIAGAGYFDYENDTCDRARMARDWERHGDSVLAEWIAEHPGTRPFAWWEFDTPEPKRPDEREHDYLARLGLLIGEEMTDG